jgi:hypothetical protein
VWSKSKKRFDWVLIVDCFPEALYLVQATPDEAAVFAISLRKPGLHTTITMEAVDLTVEEVL